MEALSKMTRYHCVEELRSAKPFLNSRFGFDSSAVELDSYHMVKQVHGAEILPYTQAGAEADGVYADCPGIKVTVKTADCLPVLLESHTGVIAIHAGWRGIAAGILPAALQRIQLWGDSVAELRVVIGPHIGLKRFEVGEDVIIAFSKAPGLVGLGPEAYALQRDNGKWHVDLAAAAGAQIVSAGGRAEHIKVLASCTYDHPELWPSYRRSGGAMGRLYSWIERGSEEGQSQGADARRK